MLAVACLACTSVQTPPAPSPTPDPSPPSTLSPTPTPTPQYETPAAEATDTTPTPTPTPTPDPDSEDTLVYPPPSDLPLWEYGADRASITSYWSDLDVFVLECTSGNPDFSIELGEDQPLPGDERRVSVKWLSSGVIVDWTREVWARSRDGRTMYASGQFVQNYFDFDGYRSGRIETDAGGDEARVFQLWPAVPLDTSRLSCFP